MVDQLKKLAAKADAVYLAPDPDREGEAIAAHLAMQLMPLVKDKSEDSAGDVQRDHAEGGEGGVSSMPRDVDENLVDAQQTRRVLDRMVGYQISPLLWDKVRRGLSAGRVQTVALRLIVEREREIKAFKPVEYWTIDAELTPAATERTGIYGAMLVRRSMARNARRGRKEQFLASALPDQAATDAVVGALEKADWRVRSVEKKERRRNPTARLRPASCSRMRRASWASMCGGRWAWRSDCMKAWRSAGRNGRSDHLYAYRFDARVAGCDCGGAGVHRQNWARSICRRSRTRIRARKDAQDAHEAIRPTNVELHAGCDPALSER